RLVVRGTAGSAARAVLRRVALARRGAADDGRGLEGVGRAGRARPVAGLVLVARAGRRAAHRAGVPRRVLAGIVRPVAGVGRARAAVVSARRPRRALGIRWAARSCAGAVLRRVALPRRGTALREGRQETVRRTGRTGAVARLGGV